MSLRAFQVVSDSLQRLVADTVFLNFGLEGFAKFFKTLIIRALQLLEFELFFFNLFYLMLFEFFLGYLCGVFDSLIKLP